MQLILRDPETIAAVLKFLSKNPKLLANEKSDLVAPKLQAAPRAHHAAPAPLVRGKGQSYYDERFGVEFVHGLHIRRVFGPRSPRPAAIVEGIIDNGKITIRDPETKQLWTYRSFFEAEKSLTSVSNGFNVWIRWEFQAVDNRWYKISRLREAQGRARVQYVPPLPGVGLPDPGVGFTATQKPTRGRPKGSKNTRRAT